MRTRGWMATLTRRMLFLLSAFFFCAAGASAQSTALRVFNVKDYGATGRKADSAQAAIQKAIDACALAGGGIVYLPPGGYSSGTIHLRSHVRLHVEAGATLFSIKDKSAFDQDALIFGENLENVTIEGRGTIDGQAEYEWRPDDIEDDFIRPNKELMLSLGKPITRSFPKKNQFGKLVLLLRCKDVRIAGLSFINSPSWTIHPYGCERVVIDGVYIRSSLREGVWADGIDPDGCKDLRISNSTIETGDDAICFYSMNWFGPALPCENIAVTNCRLTSASSAIKFSDGNMNAIRNVTIDNTIITGANRGIAFMDFDGGAVSDVVLSNLTIETVRHDWFWWGDGDPLHFNIKRRSEVHKSVKPGTDAPAGKIRRVLITNVIARGKGSSIVNGHPESWLEDITIDNFKLYISSDPKAPYDKAVHGLTFRHVKNLTLKDVEVSWGEPESAGWQSALSLEEITGLVLDGFVGRQAKIGAAVPAVILREVEDAVIRNARALAGTGTFFHFTGRRTSDITLDRNDLRKARVPYSADADVRKGAIRTVGSRQ
jgi:Glycosyl hydrolases family 28